MLAQQNTQTYFSPFAPLQTRSPIFLPSTTMSVLTPKTPSKEELSLRKLTDDVVAGHIYAKHRDDGDEKTKIDVNNYISFLETTLANVDQISEAFSRVIPSFFICFF